MQSVTEIDTRWGMLTGILSHPTDCDERLFSQQSLYRELLLVEFVCVGCVFEMCIVFVLRFSCSFQCMSSNMNAVYDEMSGLMHWGVASCNRTNM